MALSDCIGDRVAMEESQEDVASSVACFHMQSPVLIYLLGPFLLQPNRFVANLFVELAMVDAALGQASGWDLLWRDFLEVQWLLKQPSKKSTSEGFHEISHQGNFIEV